MAQNTAEPQSQAAQQAHFFRQSGWLMLANVLSGMLMWGVHFFAQAIPKPEYAIFVVLIAVAMSIPTMPLQMVMAQQAAQALVTRGEAQLSGMIRLVVGGTLLLGLIGACFVIVFREQIIARWAITNPAALWITVPVVLLALVLPIFWGLLQGQQNFLWLGWSMMSSGIGRFFIAGVAVFALGCHAAGMLTGVLIGMIAATLLAVWQTRTLWLIKPAPFAWRPLLRQVIPLMLGFAVLQFLFTADTMFAKAYFSGATVAVYGAAGTMSRALMWLVTPLATVMFPRMVHSTAKAERSDLLGLVLAGTAILATLGAISLSLLGPWVIQIVYGKSYVREAMTLLPWYAALVVPLSVGNVLLNSLMARGSFRCVPWLCAMLLAYGLALTRFNATPVMVLQTLGVFNVVFLTICALFSWLDKQEAVKRAASTPDHSAQQVLS